MKLALVALVLVGCEGGTSERPDAAAEPSPTCGSEICAADEHCNFFLDNCGNGNIIGGCVEKPTTCTDTVAPVCGCDGQLHTNRCQASALGVDLDAEGNCPLEPGTFKCGFIQCDLATEYCQVMPSFDFPDADSFACMALPACSGTVDCACMLNANVPCSAFCTGDATVGLSVRCNGL